MAHVRPSVLGEVQRERSKADAARVVSGPDRVDEREQRDLLTALPQPVRDLERELRVGTIRREQVRSVGLETPRSSST
jgi:hypothetical protein